jgi:hypothetical protein
MTTSYYSTSMASSKAIGQCIYSVGDQRIVVPFPFTYPVIFLPTTLPLSGTSPDLVSGIKSDYCALLGRDYDPSEGLS